MTNIKPDQNEMKEVQKLFESNDFVPLEKKLKELISSYPSISNLYNILGVVLQKKNASRNRFFLTRTSVTQQLM